MQNPTKPKPPLRRFPRIPAPALALLFLAITVPARAQPASCQAPAAVQHDLEYAAHVPTCSEIDFTHYPPTSGMHYPVWASYRTFNFVLNPGYYIHSMEHGAVVLLVNCKTMGNCQDDFARLQRIANAAPKDSLCDDSTKHRIIIAEDTVIGKRFAAVAWGWSLESDCADSAAFAAFIAAHYGHGTEQTCALDTNFSGPNLCNGPVGLQAIPGHPSSPSIQEEEDGGGLSRILWRGSLTRRGTLRLEVLSLTGVSLRRYDLGVAGPGRASAAWDAQAFKKEFPGARRVAMRLTLGTTAGSRHLAEFILAP